MKIRDFCWFFYLAMVAQCVFLKCLYLSCAEKTLRPNRARTAPELRPNRARTAPVPRPNRARTAPARTTPEPRPNCARTTPEPRPNRARTAPVPNHARTAPEPRPNRARTAPEPPPNRARTAPEPRPEPHAPEAALHLKERKTQQTKTNKDKSERAAVVPSVGLWPGQHGCFQGRFPSICPGSLTQSAMQSFTQSQL